MMYTWELDVLLQNPLIFNIDNIPKVGRLDLPRRRNFHSIFTAVNFISLLFYLPFKKLFVCWKLHHARLTESTWAPCGIKESNMPVVCSHIFSIHSNRKWMKGGKARERYAIIATRFMFNVLIMLFAKIMNARISWACEIYLNISSFGMWAAGKEREAT